MRMPRGLSIQEKLARYTKHDPVKECLVWQGGYRCDGYGSTKVNGKSVAVHRAAWTLVHGEPPPGKLIRHSCDTPGCCNVDHLTPGTDLSNTADKRARDRFNHHPRRFSAAEIDEMRALHATGLYTRRDLQDLYGISRRHISYVIAGKLRGANPYRSVTLSEVAE